jgi:hypothetical protein
VTGLQFALYFALIPAAVGVTLVICTGLLFWMTARNPR